MHREVLAVKTIDLELQQVLNEIIKIVKTRVKLGHLNRKYLQNFVTKLEFRIPALFFVLKGRVLSHFSNLMMN